MDYRAPRFRLMMLLLGTGMLLVQDYCVVLLYDMWRGTVTPPLPPWLHQVLILFMVLWGLLACVFVARMRRHWFPQRLPDDRQRLVWWLYQMQRRLATARHRLDWAGLYKVDGAQFTSLLLDAQRLLCDVLRGPLSPCPDGKLCLAHLKDAHRYLQTIVSLRGDNGMLWLVRLHPSKTDYTQLSLDFAECCLDIPAKATQPLVMFPTHQQLNVLLLACRELRHLLNTKDTAQQP